jgi:tetratricopeptide (TPR) repeat protein
MLETIREYAAEQLTASGRGPEYENRYLEYFRTLARDTCLRGEIHEYDFASVDPERDNLRSALAAAFADDCGQALEMAGALSPYWYQRGDFHEARNMLASALAATPDAISEACARAVRWSGQFALHQSELDTAERLGNEALRLSGELNDHRGAGFALSLLGSVAMYRNDFAESARLLEASLAEHVAGGSQSGQLVSRANLAGVANALGDHRRAIELGREVVAASRGRDEFGVAHMLCTIGISLEALGQAEEARATFEECIAVSRAHGFSEAEAYGLASLAHLELADAPALAVHHYRESMAILREIADLRGIAYCLEGLAAVAVVGENAADAVTLLGAAAMIRERTDASLDPLEQLEVDRTLAKGREALSPDEFDAAWSHGSLMELDDAIELALSAVDASSTPTEQVPFA